MLRNMTLEKDKPSLVLLVFSAVLVLLANAGFLQASPIYYSGSSGSLSASALFELSESTLTITMTNTSMSDVLVPANVLTGVFFNTSHTLTPISASLNGSSTFYGIAADPGDGWGYGSGVNAQGMNSAISASGAVRGLGHSNFSEVNSNLQGLNYGILSLGDDFATGNNGVKNKGPLFKNSIQYTFTTADGFTLAELGNNLVFQYGTSLSEPSFDGHAPETPPVPEPGTILLLGTGLGTLVLGKRYRKHLDRKKGETFLTRSGGPEYG